MGAELYIEKIRHSLMQKYEPIFEVAVRRRDSLPPQSKEAEAAQLVVTKYYDLMYSKGYFKDSYNATNVLWQLGLSWREDVMPLCTKNRKMCHDKLHKFRDMVASAKLELPSKEEIENHSGKVDEQGENSLAEWHKYFVKKRKTLITFLDKAIKLNSPVCCSIQKSPPLWMEERKLSMNTNPRGRHQGEMGFDSQRIADKN